MKISKKVSFLIVAAVFVGVVVGLILSSNLDLTFKSYANNKAGSALRAIDSAEFVQDEVIPLQNIGKAFVAVAREVSPSVVTITSERKVRFRHPFSEFFGDEFFRFFGEPEREQVQRGLGSGVIVNSNGYILTNHHVIDGADDINVVIDKKEYSARKVGSDSKTDIAVIKVDVDNLTAVRFGDSDALEVGEWVLAIGSPFAEFLEKTVTAGIVSAKGRRGLAIGRNSIQYQDFIQTDAAINPGNSGGALVNLKGELIGINTAIVGQANVGIGFAIPINLAKGIMDQLVETGKVVRGWLGVWINPVNENLAKAFGLDKPGGALVASVEKGSPADKAGIQEEDIILEFNGVRVENQEHLTNLVAAERPGKEVKLKVFRNRKVIEIKASLKERVEEEIAEAGSARSGEVTLGLTVQDLTPDLARRLRLQETEGVVVVNVERASPADRENIRAGDLIRSINRKDVRNVREYNRLINQLKEGDVLLFKVQRGDVYFYAGVKVPKQ